MVLETRIHPSSLIMPLFILEGDNTSIEIKSMPGIFRLTTDLALKEARECYGLGIKSFVLFPVVDDRHKDKYAVYSHHPENFYLQTIRSLKENLPDCTVITDVAMDPYSSDGHDGLYMDGHILNDETLEILGKMTVAQAAAGADIIGPSDMMDGRVGYLRNQLDLNGFTNVSIMSYTAKFASCFYGPFRDALDSAPKSGNKLTYQMHPANRREAMLEARLDEEEGADYLMVKPALAYLDIISDLRRTSNLPIVAYHVSGEYAMIKAAAEKGWLNEAAAIHEVLTSIRRAGADIIITYFARRYAEMIKG